jgi:CheY-like chemotaxis protein
MITQPRALVLEDVRSEREELRRLLEVVGFEVWATASPAQARQWVAVGRHYDIALIDWDMSRSEDSLSEPTSQLVLEALAIEARDTLTIVHAGNLSTVRLNDLIQRSHPGALLHDKIHGAESLQDRVHRLLTSAVGDLELYELNRGMVVHRSSGRVFRHRVAFQLLTRHPKPVLIPRESREGTNGVYRFRRWLKQHGSSVAVVNSGLNRYGLVVGGGDAADDR